MMGYFAGDWKLDRHNEDQPQLSGGAVYVDRSTASGCPANTSWKLTRSRHGPLGDVHSVRMMEYNAAEKVYTYNEYNSLGEHMMADRQDRKAQNWVWNADEKLNGVVDQGPLYHDFRLAELVHLQVGGARSRAEGGLTVTEGTATRAQ